MTAENLRYIVFLLSPNTFQYLSGKKVETHDGKIFCSLEDAKEYAIASIEEGYCTRFVIGVFCLDKDAETMGITHVESFGFRHDKKNVKQLELF